MNFPWLDSAWQEFLQRLAQGRLQHGILLHGPAGLGKLEMARDMTAMLLCQDPGEAVCGQCRSCQLLAGGAHPDRFEILLDEGKHQIRIDQVRAVLASLALTTTISKRKVATIAPADAMNRNAANALLKTLEEPSGDTVMILVSDDVTRLPVTVRSRCQTIAVRLPHEDEALEWLHAQGGLGEEGARQALQAAAGSPLAALQLQQQGHADTFREVRQRLTEMLGRPRAASACAAAWKELDPVLMWRWLSLNAAGAARTQMSGDASDWLTPGLRFDGRRLARLQGKADRNRGMATTGVRQDLLLQEWLLEWAGQPLARTDQDRAQS